MYVLLLLTPFYRLFTNFGRFNILPKKKYHRQKISETCSITIHLSNTVHLEFGFRPGDSATNQLIDLVDEIHQVFDSKKPLEVRAIFLDISKAFDKV